MNKQRRQWLSDTIAKLEDVVSELNNIRDEEEDCYDNLPEGIQESERGETMQEIIDGIDSEISDLETVIENLNGVVEL